MNDRYKNAMDQLPFSDDLEARTLAMLEASSAQIAKEEEPMKQENQRKPLSRTKLLAVGGSVLAAAACLVLVILPLLTGGQDTLSQVENVDVVSVNQTVDADAGPEIVDVLSAPDVNVAAEAAPAASMADGAQSNSNSASVNNTATTGKTDIYMKIGSSGSQVKILQNQLISLGYLTGEADGDFAETTETAVIAFQKASSLYSDGIAGPTTLTKLYSASAIHATAAVAHLGSLEEGMEGDGVKALQQKLTDLGYYTGTIDGIFNAEMTNSLKELQASNNLTVTGKADPTTASVIYGGSTLSDSANSSQASASSKSQQSISSVADSAPMADALPPQATGASNQIAAVGGDFDWGSWDHEYAEADGAAPMGMAARYAGEEPYWNTEEYTTFQENRFLSTRTSPLSTFAADVDTASYAKLRASILAGDSVPEDSVRIEEMLNYFSYTYAPPKEGEPFGITTEIADCPWSPDTKLLLVGLQAEEIDTENVPPQNLVFLIDVSGSMDEPAKLPLVKRSFLLLLEELKPTDTVSIVTYAGADRVVLDGVRASDKTRIAEAIENMSAGGGTAGAAGISTAYQIAEKHFIEGGNNRIILATDGDLNIGVSDEGSLTRMVEEKRKSGVYLSVLGYGMGNYKDNKLEALADNGNGNYAYIDTIYEARKALVEEMGATFFTVAKDVKLQVEFNPAKVKGYRLIGYENRTMAAEDFANDQKDGGEVGSGHRVTVLYELVPVDSAMEIDTVETKYQTAATSGSNEWLTVSIRAKKPDKDTSDLYTYPVDESAILPAMSDNLRYASAVVEVGMLLRDSEYKGTASYQSALDRLRGTSTVSGDVYKEEFQYMVSMLARQNPETSAPAGKPTVDPSPTLVPLEDNAGQP